MKQRLGVAAALLGEPELLILDEPTNGLDPAGMADMRALIRSLAGNGHTILLSSHMLGEVQQICDRVGVISNGRLVAAWQSNCSARNGSESSRNRCGWTPRRKTPPESTGNSLPRAST
jgi:ABC-type multidrug transport system ATPase subunit